MKYYEDVRFPENCKGIIDVTKAPYFVDNTGKEDCTEKFCRILDDILGVMIPEMQAVYESLRNAPDGTYVSNENRKLNGRVFAIFPNQIDQIPSIYLPNGTYLVSDTISYTLRDLHNMMYHYSAGGFELNRCIRFIGQNREKTIIKLKDNCKGFEYGQERAVINFMLGERSNVAMSNYFENITVDVGKGNPGAVGIIFFANNSGAIRNVTVRSSDENGDGYAGIWIKHEIHSSANIYNTSVEGFRFGINISTFRTCSHLENITLKNQQRYGITITDNVVQIIGLKSYGNVPALNVSGPMAHVVLTDADILSDGTEYTAIKYTMGVLFVRNVMTKGFKASLEQNWFEQWLPDGYIEEYCTHSGYTLFDKEAKSLNLKVPPLPDITRENDFSKWCCVNDFGAVGDGVHDDTICIQKAFNSGKPVIWFEPGRYLITSPIEIPSSVEHVNFMYCDIIVSEKLGATPKEAVFHIVGDSNKILFAEKLFSWNFCIGEIRMFRHDSKRTVYMRDMHTQACAFYFNTVSGGEVFFENCACTIGKKAVYGHIPAFEFNGQTAWCHSINPERSMSETVNRGGTLWWSGFKTEQEGSLTLTSDGGTTEILGGIAVVGAGTDRPLVYNENSDVSAIFSTTGYHSFSSFPVAVKEVREKETRILSDSKLPCRYWPWYFVPLYSGRNKKDEKR